MTKVYFKFPDRNSAEAFLHWLDGQGEQQYWDWMEFQDNHEETTIDNFKYDFRNLIVDCKKGKKE